MQYIQDSNALEWCIDLNLGIADRLDAFVRDAYQVDLFDPVAMMGLLSRPTNVVSVASCICAEQWEQRHMEPADFGRGWKGGEAYKLQRVLWEEYRDFFPNPATQDLLNSTMKRLNDLSASEEKIVEKALDQLAEVMTEAVEELKQTIEGELKS